MARPGLLAHRKFIRLVRKMESQKIGDEAQALGHLEFMFLICGSHANELLGDSEDVESIARYKKADGKLCSLLEDCGFIEQHADGKYYLHDLYDNTTDSIRKRIARRRTMADNGGQTADNGRITDPNQTEPNQTKESARFDDRRFEYFWMMYPKQIAQGPAEREWKDLRPSEQQECLTRLPAWVEANRGTETRFLPKPHDFLKDRRWRDDLKAVKAQSVAEKTKLFDEPEPPKTIPGGQGYEKDGAWYVGSIPNPAHAEWLAKRKQAGLDTEE